jgi:gamma-aminobutyric acid receptor subunit beta
MLKASRIVFTLLLMNISVMAQGQTVSSPEPGCEFPDSVRHSRPGTGQGATEIRVGVYLIDIPKIDDADQSYVADIFLRYEWKDARLANGRDAPCTVPAADIWNPGVLVVNQRSVQRQMNDVVEVQADGTVRYVQRFYGTYSVPLDLRRFPFDSQKLPITLVARFRPEDLRLVVDEQLFAVADQLSSPNWSIGSPIAATGEYRVQPGRSIAQLQILFPAKRRSGYYVWKLIVPMSFVVFMSWAVFWLSPQNLAPRTGLSATSMLTLIAFRLALGSSLPPISYLTELDVFTIGATILVFAALAQAVVTTALWERERKQLAQSLNSLSRVLFPAAFALLLALSFSRFNISV